MVGNRLPPRACLGACGLSSDEQTLLAAFVADKAVYECVYEARNRPGWVSIPIAALVQVVEQTVVSAVGTGQPAESEAGR